MAVLPIVDMYIVSSLCGKFQKYGLFIQVLFIFFYSIMLQNTAQFAPLFTFAPSKFEPFHSEQKKKKFPFLRRPRNRPITSIFKIKTLENDCRKDEQEVATIKTEQNVDQKYYRNFGSFAEVSDTINQQEVEKPHQIINPEKSKSNRINLPSVFDKKLQLQSSKKQKRSISSQHQPRNSKDSRASTLENKTRYGQEEVYGEIVRKKMMGSENKEQRGSLVSKLNEIELRKINKRICYAVDNAVIDSSLLEGIRKMKKIYN